MYKKNKNYSVVLNGSFPRKSSLIEMIKNSDFIIATDGAGNTLIDNNVIPNVVIGDLDSFKKDENRKQNIIETIDQSKTDFQKSLDWCVENNIKSLSIFAISGKSEDHFLGSLYILNEYSNLINWRAYSDFSIISPSIGEKSFNSFRGQKVSLFTLNDQSIVSSKNLEYELDKYKLLPSAKAARNISKANNFILKSSSKLIVFQSVQ